MKEKHINFTEAEERAHLEYVRSKLKFVLDGFGSSVRAQFSSVMKLKRYLQESKTDMDHIEKADMRESIDQTTRIGEMKKPDLPKFFRRRFIPYCHSAETKT